MNKIVIYNVEELSESSEENWLGIVKNGLASVLNRKIQFSIDRGININGLLFDVYKISDTYNIKYCIKKKGEKIFESDFIFDQIGDLFEFNGRYYYEARIGNKWGYIELGKESEFEQKLFFDGIVSLRKRNKHINSIYYDDYDDYDDYDYENGKFQGSIVTINGKKYYKARIGSKYGYIELGKESEYKEKLIFDYVGDLFELNGKYYYEARIGNKKGYIELGKENEFEEKVIFESLIKLKYIPWYNHNDLEYKFTNYKDTYFFTVNGEYYYFAIIGQGMGVIKMGCEKERKEKLIFDDILWYKEINGKLYYKVKIGNKYGLIEYDNEDGCENVIIFDAIYVDYIYFINGKIRYRVLYGKKNRHTQIGMEYKFKQSFFSKLTSLVNQKSIDSQRLANEPSNGLKMLGNTDGFMQQLEKIYEEIPQHYKVDLNYNDQYLIEGKLILQKQSTLSENEWKQFLENFDTELEIVISGCNYYQLMSIIDDYEIKVQNTIEKINIFD